MRNAAGLILASAMSLWAASAGAQTPKAGAPAPTAAAVPAPLPPPAAAKSSCANPDALGIGRTVEIDTTGGPGFGFEHFKQLDFLREKEVVLTFDDGPWQTTTPAVLGMARSYRRMAFGPLSGSGPGTKNRAIPSTATQGASMTATTAPRRALVVID
eukprot:gene65559-89682_t